MYKPALLALGLFALTSSFASAETAFWVTCDFNREGSRLSDHLGVFPESRGELVTNGFENGHSRDVLVTPLGETLYVFEEVASPEQYRWLWSINLETMQGIAFSEGYPTPSLECRVGAE